MRAALRAGFRRAPGTSIAGSAAIDADGPRSAAGAIARARPASHIFESEPANALLLMDAREFGES